MSRIWRLAFAWLLAIALPLQGYAAQAMTLCGPAHHAPAAAPAAKVLDHPAAVAHMVHTAHTAHATSDASQAAPSDEGSGADEQWPSGHAGKCSVCASCCNAAALAVAAPVVPVVPPQPVDVATIPQAQERMWVGGLERPPRALLA
ncbi:hypothetical protein LZ017_10535 [Pelomonas sp. CA6]|uniref:hypothetical protein n=1 Tax=Pelomonas sp. CA6 TaxID=2907999 RepID=UPI001F4BDF68|nr:hypothetical protein [Pelomonas sp. CA6]MCH7343816.1 hypothetical protein [Pelomonas sp. CA6]